MRAILILLALAAPAEANTLQQARDWAHCRFYPSHARCRPAEPVQTPSVAPPAEQAPVPPAPPVAAPESPQPPPLVAPQPTLPAIVPAPVAVPAPTMIARPKAHPPKAKPAKHKPPQKPKRKKRSALDEPGPDLPWPCALVRWHASGKTCPELIAEGRRRQIKLSRKQLYQAAQCIGRCFPS